MRLEAGALRVSVEDNGRGISAEADELSEGLRGMRERMEPAVDDLMTEFHKFRRTLEKVGDMANDGLRAFNEFQAARGQSPFPQGPRTSH